MSVLAKLQPEKVFYYFEEISKIPHGSGNIDQISEYIVEFAKQRGLTYYQDAAKNVIIMKKATPGYEKEPALILQGHMDMVAVKTPGSTKDMKTEGLDIAIDGDYIYAKETSLGGRRWYCHSICTGYSGCRGFEASQAGGGAYCG